MRLAGKLKLGFFPLPMEHGPSIRARLAFPAEATPATALDPCAGTGAALKAITEDSGALLYGVELDANRAEIAQAAGIHLIQGNVFDVRCRVQRVSLLYLNPPYDFEIGPLANKRMERLFLGHTYAWLVPKGVLVMVIPRKAIREALDTLATRFCDIRIYRMEGEESRKYDQFAVFGVRHDNNGKDADAIRASIRRLLDYPAIIPTLIPEPDLEYQVPPGRDVELTYQGIPLDQVEDHLTNSEAWKKASQLLLPKQEVFQGRPLTPLHGGHVGLIATAGMLNGAEGEGEERHIARWRPVKHTMVSVEYEDEQEIVRTKERFSNELALVYCDGNTLLLNENEKETKAASQLELVKGSGLDDDNGDEDDPGHSAEELPVAAPLPAGGHRFNPGRLAMTPGIQELAAFKGLNV